MVVENMVYLKKMKLRGIKYRIIYNPRQKNTEKDFNFNLYIFSWELGAHQKKIFS